MLSLPPRISLAPPLGDADAISRITVSSPALGNADAASAASPSVSMLRTMSPTVETASLFISSYDKLLSEVLEDARELEKWIKPRNWVVDATRFRIARCVSISPDLQLTSLDLKR